MNFIIIALLVVIAAGTTFGQSIITNLRRGFSPPTVVAQTTPNVVLQRYKDEQERKLAELGDKVESVRQKDVCIADADIVRRANPDDRSMTNPGRFCD